MIQYIFIGLCLLAQTPLCAFLDSYRASQAYSAGDLEKAQHILEPVFVRNQHDAQAAYNLGKIAYKKKEFAQAETYTKRAADYAHDRQLQIQAYFDTGNAQVQQKKWQEALQSYQEVIARDAEHAQARDMIEQIQKVLNQQQQEQQQSQNDDKNQQQEKQDQDKQQQDKQENNKQQNKDENNKNKESQEQGKNSNQDQQQQGQEAGEDQQEKNQQGQQQQENSTPSQDNQDEHKDADSEAQGSDSEMNKEKSAQNGKDQRPKDQLGNKEREKEGEQEGKKDEQQQQQQQPQGQIDNQPPESLSGNGNQSKNDDANQHHDKPSTSPVKQSCPSQDTQEEQKGQVGKDTTSDKEELLLSLLEERDAELVKSMLKAQVKQQMPRTHGQKNW